MNTINEFTDEELQQELDRRKIQAACEETLKKLKEWGNPYGVWRISTEGDCEGRTVNVLATRKGHIADLARIYERDKMYTLTFTKIDLDEDDIVDTPSEKGSFSLNYHTFPSEVGGHHLAMSQKVHIVQEWIGPNFIVESYERGSFIVSKKKT